MTGEHPSASSGRTQAMAAAVVLGALVVLLATGAPLEVRRAAVNLANVGASGVALVAVLGAARRSHGELRRAWRLAAVAGTGWFVGNVIWSYLQLVADHQPFPSLADAFYLAAIPFAALALLAFLDLPRARERRLRALLDGCLMATSLFVISWALVLGDLEQAVTGGALNKAVVLAYPVGDVILVSLAIALSVRGRLTRTTAALLAGGAVAYAVADTNLAYFTLRGTHEIGGAVDGFWTVAYVLVALAALRYRSGAEQEEEADRVPSPLQLLLPYLPAGAACAALFVRRGQLVDDLALATAALAMVLLALTRQIVLLRENTRLAIGLEQAVAARTAELRDREAELSYQTFHDPVTGLANRALFCDRVERALAIARRQETGIGVLFVDVDDFKTVNEALGHTAGDAVLTIIGQRVMGQLRPLDTVARLGGDEFAVLIEPLVGATDASKVTERILAAVSEPIAIEGQEIQLSASIGIAMGNGDTNLEDLLSHADVAMYRAKQSGKAGFAMFEAEMQQQVLQRLTVRAELQRAIENQEIAPHYQPIVDLATGRIVAVEALARWNHPERGLLSPFHFVPLAEETGQVVAIGQQILAQAVKQLQAWRLDLPDVEDLSVSVNLSARQLQDAGLVDEIASALANSGLPPTCLILEVTETMIMVDIDAAVARLRRLQAFGVRIALDDFGTGFSSLSYLQKLPIDELKIDKSFIDLLANDATRDAQWAEAVVALGRILDLTVIAEGIESDHQLSALRHLRCARGQGYLFARPVPPEELAELLRNRTTPTGYAAEDPTSPTPEIPSAASSAGALAHRA
jgi:diguanylate cyclase